MALEDDDEQLRLAVAQTIDALTFLHTHEVDLDFRAHSKSTVESVRSLQKEQRNRVQTEYGPHPPSPDFLGTQLLAVYRGEAASVQLAKETADPEFPTAVGAMSEQQCRLFKKEMKQRIHEWEGSVREVTGQSDVLAEQKTPLRSIYELYKVGKNKVVALDATKNVPLEERQPASLTSAELLTEKRRLKQILSKFESDFERANGERPSRKDRQEFAEEYHRYGEIRNELTRRGTQ